MCVEPSLISPRYGLLPRYKLPVEYLHTGSFDMVQLRISEYSLFGSLPARPTQYLNIFFPPDHERDRGNC